MPIKQAIRDCSKLQQVHFGNPNGWKVSENIDMTDAETISGLDNTATAAEYFTSSSYYRDYYWKREG